MLKITFLGAPEAGEMKCMEKEKRDKRKKYTSTIATHKLPGPKSYNKAVAV